MRTLRAYRIVVEAFIDEKLSILKVLRARLRREYALASLRGRRSLRRLRSRPGRRR